MAHRTSADASVSLCHHVQYVRGSERREYVRVRESLQAASGRLQSLTLSWITPATLPHLGRLGSTIGEEIYGNESMLEGTSKIQCAVDCSKFLTSWITVATSQSYSIVLTWECLKGCKTCKETMRRPWSSIQSCGTTGKNIIWKLYETCLRKACHERSGELAFCFGL